jgi:hypothetical protein
MLTVLPIQSKDTQRELCEICGVTYNENAFAYRADDGDFIGICQFYFKDNKGYIDGLTYAPNVSDWEAMIIMLRTAMNFMFRCGIKKSIFEANASTEELLKKSGYRHDENGIYSIDIDKFYNTPCHS